MLTLKPTPNLPISSLFSLAGSLWPNESTLSISECVMPQPLPTMESMGIFFPSFLWYSIWIDMSNLLKELHTINLSIKSRKNGLNNSSWDSPIWSMLKLNPSFPRGIGIPRIINNFIKSTKNPLCVIVTQCLQVFRVCLGKVVLNHICIWSFLFDFPHLESMEISLFHLLWNILNQRWNVVFYLRWITLNTSADIFRCSTQGTCVFRWSWHIQVRSTLLMVIRDPTSCISLHQP